MKQTLAWIGGIGCNGCTHAFLNTPSFWQEAFFHHFELLTHPIYAPIPLEESPDIILLAGVFNPTISHYGLFSYDEIVQLCYKAKRVYAIGTCSSFGGIHAHMGQGAMFVKEEKGGFLGENFRSQEGLPVINIPGCPPNGEWILEVLLSSEMPSLDGYQRPLSLFGSLVHNGCNRNEYFEWKIEAKKWGTTQGCLFAEHGCRGPLTHSGCNTKRWQGSSKTLTGQPCFGCTEPHFPLMNFFHTKSHLGIPSELPYEIPKRAYFALAAVAKTFTIERLVP